MSVITGPYQALFGFMQSLWHQLVPVANQVNTWAIHYWGLLLLLLLLVLVTSRATYRRYNSSARYLRYLNSPMSKQPSSLAQSNRLWPHRVAPNRPDAFRQSRYERDFDKMSPSTFAPDNANPPWFTG